MTIPFVDLEAQYDSIKDEISHAIDEVLNSRAFIQGKFADAFSEEFLNVHGGGFGSGCSNGTAAISLALRLAP